MEQTTTKTEKALQLFMQGYNCSQAVFAAFAADMGMDEAASLRLSSSFGGGMGGLREVCGAVSGMFMAMGVLHGYDVPDDAPAKAHHYARLQAMAARFTDAYGTLICRDLLQKNDILAVSIPAERNSEYYLKRPCARYVQACAAILEDTLAQEG